MFSKVLERFREKIQSRQYVVTIHAEDGMNDDDFSIFDVEHVILTGRVYERQRDINTGEWKYGVIGKSIDSRSMTVFAKISFTEKLVIITVYEN